MPTKLTFFLKDFFVSLSFSLWCFVPSAPMLMQCIHSSTLCEGSWKILPGLVTRWGHKSSQMEEEEEDEWGREKSSFLFLLFSPKELCRRLIILNHFNTSVRSQIFILFFYFSLQRLVVRQRVQKSRRLPHGGTNSGNYLDGLFSPVA